MTKISCAILAIVLLMSRPSAAPATEILWDRYGVPHIYAANRESMFFAHGWAQMRNHADLLLRLYGESRGRAAEYWGGDANLELDRWVQLNGIPERAREWYDAQDPRFRGYLDEFARGINEFAVKNPSAIDPQHRLVLPVTGVDVVQHPLRAVHYGYMGSRARMNTEVTAMLKNQQAAHSDPTQEELAAGSNTWAISPSRSASGNAMLIINPHLSWGNTFYRYMQVHLTAPDYDQIGAPQVGFPVAVVGFNRHTGWGRTVNTIDTVDFYRLTVKDGQYMFDGALRPFERAVRTLKIRANRRNPAGGTPRSAPQRARAGCLRPGRRHHCDASGGSRSAEDARAMVPHGRSENSRGISVRPSHDVGADVARELCR